MKVTQGREGILQLTSLNKGIREVRAWWKWLKHNNRVSHDLQLMEVTTKQEEVKRINVAIKPEHMKLIEQELERRTFKEKPSKRTQPIHLYFRRAFYTYVSVLASTGMRPVELHSIICWKDFSLIKRSDKATDNSTSSCLLTLRNPDGKGSRKIVSHSAFAIRSWRNYAADWRKKHGFRSIKPGDTMFAYPVTEQPYPYQQISMRWREVLETVGLNNQGYTLRSLRSTYVTNQIARGVSPYILARNTGHSVEVMRKHYEQLDEQNLIDALL